MGVYGLLPSILATAMAFQEAKPKERSNAQTHREQPASASRVALAADVLDLALERHSSLGKVGRVGLERGSVGREGSARLGATCVGRII